MSSEADSGRTWNGAHGRPLLMAMLLVLAAARASAFAQEAGGNPTTESVGHGIGSTMHDIGASAREGGREVGRGAAQIGRDVGHTARDAAVVTWDVVKRTGTTIGHAVRDGSKAFARGLKGEPGR